MINWDKGKAVTFLLESLGEFNCSFFNILFIFLNIRVICFAVNDIRNIVFRA